MITKRQLGVFVIALGALAVLGIVFIDVLDAGQWGGFGPLQRLGLLVSVPVIVVGLLLYRLGDRPA
jgi:hypothetical protein